MHFRASEAAVACGGTLVGVDADLCGASFDSRLMQSGWLFVPSEPEPGGSGRDGHDFVQAAVAAGAGAVLSRREVEAPCVIRVADQPGAVVTAAGAIARSLRVRLSPQLAGRVVGITGSVGKTSTKEFITAAMAAQWRTWSSPRSYNNDWGVPVTLMQSPDDVEALVIEMGMRGFGEIARLCSITSPQIGVVTAVAEAHTGRVGGLDGVARAKGELIEALPDAGWAVLNGDDPRVLAMSARSSAQVMTFGSRPGVDIRVENVTVDGAARARFDVATPWGRTRVSMSVSGRHMAHNAAAALAVAGICGVDLAAAAAAVGRSEAAPGRMTVTRLHSGAVLIDDAYNANPRSMRAALDALADLDVDRRVAVLGEMAELIDPVEQHLAIARYAAERSIEVVPVGTTLYGPEPYEIDRVLEHLNLADLHARCGVVVKGSRVAGLERVVQALVAR